MSVKLDKVSKLKQIQKKIDLVTDAYLSKDSLKTDPQGSYTGTSVFEHEKPVQDADDL